MWAPPPALTVSQWAERYRRLSPEASALPGQWHNPRAPFLVGIMDAVSDPAVVQVSVMAASQVGKTEVLLNVIGYYIDYDPSPILMIQPTVEMAEAVSKDRIATMLRDSPTLAAKCGAQKARAADSTILHKKFPGGHLTLTGANSPAGLASRPIRLIVADELDRHPASAGHEGSPFALARMRASTFWNRKILCTSSPTLKGESAIEAEYDAGTGEQWHLPCPACGALQPLEWERLDLETAAMACGECGVLSPEPGWKAGAGCWVAAHPERRLSRRHRSFQLSALASHFVRWTELVADFRDAEAKGTQAQQVFQNTRLARAFEQAGETLEAAEFARHCHYYHADLPDGALVVTAAVDVQADRLEVEFVGWGADFESWGLQYLKLPGSPQQPAVWTELDRLLARQFRRADGRMLPVECVCIDSGYATTKVYDFTRPRLARRIFAIKGEGGPGKPEVGPYRRGGKNRDVPIFPLGVDTLKDTVHSRVLEAREGPGFCHWPMETELADGTLRGYDRDYFEGFASEKQVSRVANGLAHHVWVKRRSAVRNEPWDLRVYNTAAIRIINPQWAALAAARGTQPATPAPAPAPPTATRAPRRGQIAAGFEA